MNTSHLDEKIDRKEYPSGIIAYFKGCCLHREDGPAVEHPNGHNEWWWNGKVILDTFGDVTEEQLKEFLAKII